MKFSKIIGLAILVIGLLLMLDQFSILNFQWMVSISIGITLLGIILFINSFGSDSKATIFISSIIFLIGVYLLVKNFTEIRFENRALFFAFFAIPGISLIMIFIDNFRRFLFAIFGLILIAVALLPAFGIINVPFNFFAGLTDVFIIIPILLILAGILYIIKAK